MNNSNLITLRVWGDFACFTRPEMKVERVSYPVMTPSAARGILEAVFWEPQMYYLIDSIRVVKRGQWISIRRNEVTRVISLDSAKTWMHSPEKTSPIQAGGGAEDGTQRNMDWDDNTEPDCRPALTSGARIEISTNDSSAARAIVAPLSRAGRGLKSAPPWMPRRSTRRPALTSGARIEIRLHVATAPRGPSRPALTSGARIEISRRFAPRLGTGLSPRSHERGAD